jgi:hypothetical protein
MKMDKHFISEIDQFLKKYNHSSAPSASQAAEIAKYEKINSARDDASAAQNEAPENNKLWD